VSSLSEPYANGWLTFLNPTNNFFKNIDYTVNLSPDFFKSLQFDKDSLMQYRINAANNIAAILGDNPVLCLSGGADSQAMIQCWQEANLKFDTAILVFNDGLNSHDTDHARLFCEQHNIIPILININIVEYLTRDHYILAEKYRCTSPQFSAHYKMFDILRDMGYTGICCGGTAFAKDETCWGPALSAAQLNYLEYAKINEYPIMGNFLGYYPDLCWSIAILTPSQFNWKVSINESLEKATLRRYLAKVQGYRRHGFSIIPQENKFTGFEKVKEYFTKQTNDGWAFEKNFRHPLEKRFGAAQGGKIILSEEQSEILSVLHNTHRVSNKLP
jgi:hypothetical protein